MGDRYRSWGRYPLASQRVHMLSWRQAALPETDLDDTSLLAFGNGRSYGDVCLNDGGMLLDTRGLSRFMHFDPETGILRCEAGVLLGEIIAVVLPRGWFLPVTPGTKFVTIGGAVANDVHGKNHHRAGTFGRHVTAFELLRSDGSRRTCSAQENPEYFAATIGGLGLTGLITWVEIQLLQVSSGSLEEERRKFRNLDEFLELSALSDRGYDYTVAWIDCLATGSELGRGVMMRANHGDRIMLQAERKGLEPRLSVPFDPPFSLVNRFSLQLFNRAYYAMQPSDWSSRRVSWDSYFYPLDSIGHWNRIYGPKGLLQYQCVLPHGEGVDALREILGRVSASGSGSFLAVLKVFGDLPSPGLLSFPRPGITLALDFPNSLAARALLDELDEVTAAVNGAVYPAKDARMSGANFRAWFPRWQQLQSFIDPAFSSGFWRRVTGSDS